jgi:hypothetical protein
MSDDLLSLFASDLRLRGRADSTVQGYVAAGRLVSGLSPGARQARPGGQQSGSIGISGASQE